MIAIVGSGITGLVAAYELQKKGHEVLLYEATDHLGGNIQSFQQGNYHLELGPNSLVLNDELFAFLGEIGLAHEILRALPRAKYRYILKNGRYRKLPTGPISLLTSAVFSWKAKRKAMGEPKVPAQDIDRETIDAFFRRRIGDELTDYVVHPFVSGVFAGDPTQLLIAEAFPRLKTLEREYGSLIKGMRARSQGQSQRGTISLKGGMHSLIHTLQTHLEGKVHTGHKLIGVEPASNGFRLIFSHTQVFAEKLILALPAHQLSEILSQAFPKAAAALGQIEYPAVSMVYSAYKRTDVGHPLDGFGALHPHKEKSFTLGSIFSSSVFPGKCPADEVLLTTFVGGARMLENALQVDDALRAGVHQELSEYLDIKGMPTFTHIQRWPLAIPQYTAAVLPSRAFAESLGQTGLWLGGNWLGGISVPDSIQHGKKLAASVMAQI